MTTKIVCPEVQWIKFQRQKPSNIVLGLNESVRTCLSSLPIQDLGNLTILHTNDHIYRMVKVK